MEKTNSYSINKTNDLLDFYDLLDYSPSSSPGIINIQPRSSSKGTIKKELIKREPTKRELTKKSCIPCNQNVINNNLDQSETSEASETSETSGNVFKKIRKKEEIIKDIATLLAESSRAIQENDDKMINSAIMVPVIITLICILFFIILFYCLMTSVSRLVIVVSCFAMVMLVIIVSFVAYYYVKQYMKSDRGVDKITMRYEELLTLLEELLLPDEPV